DIVEAARVAAVVAGEDAAFGINLDAERVAAPFRINLETLLFGMIAPHVLADHLDRRVLAPRPSDVGRHRAAVGAVEPAVGPPAQIAGAGVRVLQAEALQMHDGVAGGCVDAL